MEFQGHLASIILQSLESRQDTSLCCIIILASPLKVRKIWRPKLPKNRWFSQLHGRLRPSSGNPTNIRINFIYRHRVPVHFCRW